MSEDRANGISVPSLKIPEELFGALTEEEERALLAEIQAAPQVRVDPKSSPPAIAISDAADPFSELPSSDIPPGDGADRT